MAGTVLAGSVTASSPMAGTMSFDTHERRKV